jgi:osmotically-inducible protein OsmY
MTRRIGAGCAVAALTLFWSACSRSDEEHARQRAAEAREKARQEAHQLAHQAKQAAHDLKREINQAVNSGGPQPASGSADEKLQRGGQDLRSAGDEAKVKLDRAALIAKVKAKLASDVGLSTVTSIDVDDSGRVVTLRGTVDTPEQKKQAEYAVRQVSGVTQVVNDLRVRQ